ncbi:MAG: DinB family protein [Dehalococcoidia bacterium]|nr:MAG: hypothetical protein EDM76_04610 [bacterium]MCK6564482.1 DinB family protein [Dehalococcoidia bacterium]MCL4232275.1 DinB family protein [Dehalococcoidia bacterium]NUQ54742.1 DinB family protein [Dehalococcoidia bacterium]RIL01598.1 MAG: hypothetical protein DCC78_10160 [bacterium]
MPTIPRDVSRAFERFTRGPSLVRAAMADLDAGALNRRPKGSDWSIRDVVLHLADAEMVASVQLRLIIAEEEPSLPAFDQDLWKRRLHYLWRDPEFALGLFQQARWANAELLQQCDAAAWQRAGLHPVHGLLTLARLVEHHALHAEEHADQVARWRSAP